MAAIARVLPWFRQVTGETVNALIDAVNNLTGNGTPQAITATTVTASGAISAASLQSAGSIDTLALLTTDGAISPNSAANYVVTKAGVLAATLAAPTVTTDDGKIIMITSNTANAHTLTATGLLQCGTAAVNLATFAAQKGAGLTLMAYQGKWNVLASVGITFS